MFTAQQHDREQFATNLTPLWSGEGLGRKPSRGSGDPVATAFSGVNLVGDRAITLAA